MTRKENIEYIKKSLFIQETKSLQKLNLLESKVLKEAIQKLIIVERK